MEQLNHFEAAVLAAGMSCVYNADDWHPTSNARASDANVTAEGESSAQH
jgi:hypothetical protein